MKITKEYNLKDTVWIHIGNGKLHKGKIVDVFDLAHAGYPKDTEFYIVEVQSEIEPLLEVRTWETISQDAKGPLGCYRALKDINFAEKKFLGKVGIELPITTEEAEVEVTELVDVYDPTPEEVNAAIERAERAKRDMYNPISTDPKKRNFQKKPYAKRPRRPTV